MFIFCTIETSHVFLQGQNFAHPPAMALFIRKGHLVRYEPDKGILFVIKILPKFDMFDLKLEPDETKEKMILLCFFDEQWPK
jgi:hypothetical protein